MMRKLFSMALGALAVTVLVGGQALASNITFTGESGGNSKVVIFANTQDLTRTAKQLGLTIHRVHLSARDKERLSKLPAKGCGCAVVADDEEAFSCLRSCLQSWGVSSTTLAACGATCAVNLVGCAICVGVQEWVVLGCAQYCVWRNASIPEETLAKVGVRRLHLRVALHPKQALKPAVSRS